MYNLYELKEKLNNCIYNEDIIPLNKKEKEKLKENKIIVLYVKDKTKLIMEGYSEGIIDINNNRDFSKMEINNRESVMLKLLKLLKLKTYYYGELNEELNEEKCDLMWSFEIINGYNNIEFDIIENDEPHINGMIIDISKLKYWENK